MCRWVGEQIWHLAGTVMKNYLFPFPFTRYCHDKLTHSISFYQVLLWQIISFYFILPGTVLINNLIPFLLPGNVMTNYLIPFPSTRYCHDKLSHSSFFYQALPWQITSFHFLLPAMSWQITSLYFLLPGIVMTNYLIPFPSTRYFHDKLHHSISFYQVLSWKITSFKFLLPGTVMTN